MALRKGKPKNILEGAIDSALLAVEVFNKPRTSFRTQAYISLMVIAWTRLLHAHFHRAIGDKYYYKKKGSNRYERIDGERKAWELGRCIKEYGQLTRAERANLEFFVKLRNKIEHRNIEKRELDTMLFGECQALLNNFERRLIKLFGEEYALNENLVYSLQFSSMRTEGQIEAGKRALSADVADIKKFVETYRSALPQDVFDSQAYSIKLIQVPKISNTNRNDIAIEFVKWDELSNEDKKAFERISVLVKDKIKRQEAVNAGKLKAGQVLDLVKEKSGHAINHYDHRCLYTIFGVRPANDAPDPFETDTRYCHYDELHGDYVYKHEWVDAIVALLEKGKMKQHMWRQSFKQGRFYTIDEYL